MEKSQFLIKQKHTKEIKISVEVDHWVFVDFIFDKWKVFERLPDSVASFFNFFIQRFYNITITNCHRSVVKPTKTRRVMVVIWRWCDGKGGSLITKFWFKTNLIYSLSPVAIFVARFRKTKKRFFSFVICFECVTRSRIKVYRQSAHSYQPTRFDNWNLVYEVFSFWFIVVFSSKYHHLSIDCRRARPIRVSCCRHNELAGLDEVSFKTK